MERGLLWLPLLGLFIGLAWAGWNEYQKLEHYKQWAQQFERSKYDIYAVLGQTPEGLTWGIPTRKGPINLQTIPFNAVQGISLTLGGQPLDLEALEEAQKTTSRGRLELVLGLQSGQSVAIPFTDREIARAWYQFISTRISS